MSKIYIDPPKSLKKELNKYKKKGYATRNAYMIELLLKGIYYLERYGEN